MRALASSVCFKCAKYIYLSKEREKRTRMPSGTVAGKSYDPIIFISSYVPM